MIRRRLQDLLRRIRSSGSLRRVASRGAAAYIRLVERTTRWEIIGEPERRTLQSGEGRWILAIWHGRLLMVPPEHRPGLNVLAMISLNNDGEMIAQTLERFGVDAVRGSSQNRAKADKDRFGREAYAAARTALASRDNLIFALSPDGPRGPRMRCQKGVAMISIDSGAPVTPFAYAVRPGFILGSWDRFLLPLPFGRGVKVYGPRVTPPRRGSKGGVVAHKKAIEDALNAVTARADAALGRTPVAPDKG